MNASCYYRVSSKSKTLEMQRHAVEKAAQDRGDTLATTYSEKRSAKLLARPVLDQLRADIRAGKVRKLYVYRLDRLARSGIRDTFEVIEEIRKAGCVLVSVTESWFDMSSPVTDMILACMAWAAQMERLAINERIAGARERVEAEGKKWGRPRRLDDHAEDRVRKLRKAGKSLRQIARDLKIPLATVQRAAARVEATAG